MAQENRDYEMINSVRVILNKQWDLIYNFSIFQRWPGEAVNTQLELDPSQWFSYNFGIYLPLICCEQPKKR